MTRDELKSLVLATLEDFSAEEEVWGDDAQLCVNPEDLSVSLTENAADRPADDCYDVMEFLQPSPTDPGHWIADPEAVDTLLSEYFPD